MPDNNNINRMFALPYNVLRFKGQNLNLNT